MKNIVTKNIYIIIASVVLFGYIFILISITNFDQKRIITFEKREVQSYVKEKAITLEYFFNVRKDDISDISESKSINTYFANKDLGMSMQYGLRASLIKIDQLLKDTVAKKLFNNKNIYKDILVFDLENKILSSSNKNTNIDLKDFSLPNNNDKETYVLVERLNKKLKIFIYKTIYYKEKKVGKIIALLNIDKSFTELISLNINQFSLYSKKGLINSDSQNKKLLDTIDYVKIDIKGTPLTLVSTSLKKEQSKWPIYGIYFLIFPISFSIYYLILLNNKNIRLGEEIKNSKKDKEREKILLQQSKVVAVGEMLGNISHQWRQPLSVISTQATGIKLSLEYNSDFSKEDIIKGMDNINNQSQYLSKTIDDFRNFFKGNSNDISEFNIKDMFAIVENLTKDSFHGSYIVYNQDIISCNIRTNQNILIQALINIYNNAKDVMEEKKIASKNRFVFVKCIKEKDTIVITIKDSGGGIEDNIIEKIFEPYFTTKHESIGTGIGLYMSNQIISKQLKGTISASNKIFTHNKIKYKGAMFTIRLPIN